jgi:hypothetical protein
VIDGQRDRLIAFAVDQLVNKHNFQSSLPMFHR